jgi:hypothetical protein
MSAKPRAAQSARNAGAFMNGMKKYLATTFLSATMFFTGVAQAMQIQQFDKMAGQDQSDYINVLIDGAEKVLADEGRSDLAKQVEHLFTTKEAGDSDTLGMISFEARLASLRAIDARNAENNPGAPRLEAEHAMFQALKDNGIILPKSFMTVASGFKPKLPPQAKEKKN